MEADGLTAHDHGRGAVRRLDVPGTDLSRVVNHSLFPASGTYTIDPVHTFVTFRAQHAIVGRVRGRFEVVKGTAVIAEDPVGSRVEVEIDAASINTLMSIRDDDLRSERFLDVSRYPAITYRSSGAAEEPGGDWRVSGELTIKGIARPVDLSVRFFGTVADSFGNARLGFRATASITRADFGLNAELMKEAGTDRVRDDVEIDIDAELIRPLKTA